MRCVALLLITCILLACQPSTPKQAISFAVAQAPLNLDPRYATDAASERVNRLIYQPLVDFDNASKPAWILARGDTINDTNYRFTLIKPAVFHHGKALTSADVKATYESLLALKDAPHTAEFSHIQAIHTPDDKTVIFQLKHADKHFVSKLILGILPQDLIAQHHDFSRQPVGSGAFKFEAWHKHLHLKRLSDGQVVSFTEVKDPTVRVLKLLRGEADLIQGDLPPELVRYLKTKSNIEVLEGVGANFSYLGLNMQDPILKQHNVRLALAHGIDRKAIIQHAMVGGTRQAGAILPPEHWAGNAQLKAYDYDPEKSKQLLLKAGIKLPLKLVYKTSTDAQRVRLATILQAQMRVAGIDLEIQSLDWGTFFQDVKQGNFQLYGLTWVGIKTPEIYSKAFGSSYFPPNGFNRGRYIDADLDALISKEDWPAATQRIHEQLPYIPLWYEGQFAAMQNNMNNYAPKADGNWDDLATITRKH